MNLKQLQQFIALAETGNFHRAAEQLHMAQPPLSISIRKLEASVGTPLFVRTTRGVRLTQAGEAALNDARRALGPHGLSIYSRSRRSLRAEARLARHCEEAEGRRGNPEAKRVTFWMASLHSQ